MTETSLKAQSARFAFAAVYLPALVTGLAAVLRLINSTSRDLWYDELTILTLAKLPLSDLLKGVLNYDAHPPLYYLQLHLWMYFGTTDAWIRLNSALWGLLAVVSLLLAAWVIYGRRPALLAAGLLALSPMAVFYAQEVRMYAWMMLIGVWVWFFTHQFLAWKRPYLTGAGLVISSLAFLYSQGAAFLILATTFSYALLAVFLMPVPKRAFLRWAGLQLLIVGLYLPWLYQARSINVQHTLVPHLGDILDTLAVLAFGIFRPRPAWLGWLALAIFLGLFLAFFRAPKQRFVVIAFVLMPLLAGILVSYAVKPIWFYRTFAFITPFFNLGLALVLAPSHTPNARHRPTLSWLPGLVTGLVFASIGAALFYQQAIPRRIWTPRAAVQLVAELAAPGDVVLISTPRFFWSWAWYAVGPGQINPLTTSYAINGKKGNLITTDQGLVPQLTAGRTIWLAYRTIDDIGWLSELEGIERRVVYDAFQLRVEKLTGR